MKIIYRTAKPIFTQNFQMAIRKHDGRFRLESWPFYRKPEANFGLSFLTVIKSFIGDFFIILYKLKS
jgi:hypothetical protein